MKTTIDIPDDLFRKAKTLAASSGLTFKDILVHSLASELDKIIDLGLENKKTNQPTRKEKKTLQVEFAKSKQDTLSKPQFIKKWDFDPVGILLEDRKSRNDFVLS